MKSVNGQCATTTVAAAGWPPADKRPGEKWVIGGGEYITTTTTTTTPPTAATDNKNILYTTVGGVAGRAPTRSPIGPEKAVPHTIDHRAANPSASGPAGMLGPVDPASGRPLARRPDGVGRPPTVTPPPRAGQDSARCTSGVGGGDTARTHARTHAFAYGNRTRPRATSSG